MKQNKKLAINIKFLIIFSILIFIFVISFSIIHSQLNIRQARQMAEKYLVAITKGVTETVDAWLEEKKNMVNFISRTQFLEKYLKDNSVDIEPFLKLIQQTYKNYEGVFIAHKNGQVLVDSLSSSRDKLINIKDLPLWQEFEKRNFALFLNRTIYRSRVTEKLTVTIIKGVFDPRGDLLGFIGSSIDWDKFTQRFILPVKVGVTGYVAITDTQGRNIGHPDRTLNLKNLSHYPWMQKIIIEKNGFQRYLFKEIYKFMAYRESKESGWIVNTSVDEEELIEGTIYIRNIILLTGIVLFIAMLLIIGYIDIFKLGKAEKELKDSERKFKLIFNRGNDAIFVHRVSDNLAKQPFVQVNETFCTFIGCKKEQALTMTPGILFAPDRFDQNYTRLISETRTNKYSSCEGELITGEYDKRFVELRTFLLETGNDTFIMGFVRDITERAVFEKELQKSRDSLDKTVKERTAELVQANRKLLEQIHQKDRMESALRESEEKYRNLVERAGDGILLIQDYNIMYANERICRMLGYSRDELMENKLTSIITPAERKRVLARYQTRIDGERPPSIYETLFQKKDKSIIHVEVNAGIIAYEGRPADFVFVRDITERKRVEEERQKHREQLIQTDKLVALGTLVSGVAHEINNPNNSIMLNAPILLDAFHDAFPILEEYKANHGDFVLAGMPYSLFQDYIVDLLNDIQTSSNRIKVIVDDLKRFARPSGTELTSEIDINQVVRSAISLISSQVMKFTENFSISYGENLPMVTGSFQRLEQVMVNLIQNACHALPDRKKGIRVSTYFDENAKSIIIEVADQGKGIDPGHLGQIFDPFFTTKREQGGTGLGLSVSMNIIKEHHGELNYQSQPGEGTTVTIILPLDKNIEGKQS